MSKKYDWLVNYSFGTRNQDGGIVSGTGRVFVLLDDPIQSRNDVLSIEKAIMDRDETITNAFVTSCQLIGTVEVEDGE